jgi:hypothetical protein
MLCLATPGADRGDFRTASADEEPTAAGASLAGTIGTITLTSVPSTAIVNAAKTMVREAVGVANADLRSQNERAMLSAFDSVSGFCRCSGSSVFSETGSSFFVLVTLASASSCSS